MKKMFSKVNGVVLAAFAAVMASPVGAFAQTADPGSQAISDAQTKVLAIVAIGGAAVVAIKLAAVGWNVAAKWISRVGSKA